MALQRVTTVNRHLILPLTLAKRRQKKKNAGRGKSDQGATTEAEVKAARKRLGKQVVDAKGTESNGTEDGNQRARKEKPVGKRVNYHVNKPVPEHFYVPKKRRIL